MERRERAAGILTLALLDLRLLVRDRPAVFWTILMPVAFMWVFGRAFGGGDDRRPQANLTVVAEDQGFLAEGFTDELRGEGVDLELLAPAQADTMGERPRTLHIPAGFTDSLLAGEPVELRMEIGEGGGLRFDQLGEIRAWRAVIRLLTNMIEMDRITGREGRDDREELATRYRELAQRPPLVRAAAEDAGRGRPVPQGFGQSVPGMLTMSIIMMTVIYGAVFLAGERAEGTLRRQATVPLSRVEIMSGKLLGRLLIALAQAVILMILGSLLFGAFWGHSPLGLALTVLALAASAASLGLLFGALFRTADQAGSLGWIAPLILAALGGCWWPLEIVPRWLRMAGHVSPAAWAMDAFHGLVSFGGGLEAVWLPVLVLTGYAVGLTWLAARRLKWE
jgi:ABC-2 type transport system permease protein